MQTTTYPVNALDQKSIIAEIPGAIAATTPPTLGGTPKGKHKGLFKDHGKT